MILCQTHILQFTTLKNNVFFTSDTHFNHANIIKYCTRPYANTDEMNEDLIKRWNSVVKPNDIVFHLGDFMFGNLNRFWEFRSRLNGQIYLVHGNHDWELMDKVNVGDAFELVAAELLITVDGQKIYLGHTPKLVYDGIYKEKPTWQLFGHVHSNPNYPDASPDIKRLCYLLPFQYDVGVDNNNYTPISFADVKEIITNNIRKSK